MYPTTTTRAPSPIGRPLSDQISFSGLRSMGTERPEPYLKSASASTFDCSVTKSLGFRVIGVDLRQKLFLILFCCWLPTSFFDANPAIPQESSIPLCSTAID